MLANNARAVETVAHLGMGHTCIRWDRSTSGTVVVSLGSQQPRHVDQTKLRSGSYFGDRMLSPKPDGRPAIPADLKRRILMAAGHRCAIPTCRTVPVQLAHIEPYSEVRGHSFENLIALCPTCHTRYDKGRYRPAFNEGRQGESMTGHGSVWRGGAPPSCPLCQADARHLVPR